jgi:hypothetical protein
MAEKARIGGHTSILGKFVLLEASDSGIVSVSHDSNNMAARRREVCQMEERTFHSILTPMRITCICGTVASAVLGPRKRELVTERTSSV